MSERFKKPLPEHAGLRSKIVGTLQKVDQAKSKIWQTDAAYNYLPKSSQQIVDDMVEGTTDGIKAANDMEWVLAANEEGLDPDTIVRMWERIEQKPVKELSTDLYSSRIH